MIELEFFFNLPDGNVMLYQLSQLSRDEPWTVLEQEKILAKLTKEGAEWKQLSGETLPEGILQDIGLFIDKQNYHNLPIDIKLRWPKLVEEIVVISDREYMVICKAFVNFKSFEKMFEKFVPTMIRDEWAIHFKVYNTDFSADFVKELRRKEEEIPFKTIHKWQP